MKGQNQAIAVILLMGLTVAAVGVVSDQIFGIINSQSPEDTVPDFNPGELTMMSCWANTTHTMFSMRNGQDEDRLNTSQISVVVNGSTESFTASETVVAPQNSFRITVDERFSSQELMRIVSGDGSDATFQCRSLSPAPTPVTGLFTADSISSDSGVTITEPRIESLFSTGSGSDEQAVFEYNDGYSQDLTLSYEQTSLSPSDGVDDRYHGILEAENSNGNTMFAVHLPDNNIHVFDAQSTSPGYLGKRDNSYNTGIDSSGTHEIELSYDGTDWSINIDNGAYTRTLSGITGEINRIRFATQGSSDAYVDGSHEFNIEDQTN
ncbi:hypothetical protein [Candidatus Nanohalococcus occultus]|uniref:Archaeal Type IV pilin N-terminal domain-containing protein n=1 Tax=Candidatus Nanohalococcus occultus TaxID=2978047 RepID=A0ABY8CGT7_9ARCH|nr:hypothetical protein SVXNc_0116 [Candidatus Nanohaloarchaeota archaeon SVXNc]